MIGILIVAHGALGESLIHCASHVMGKRPLYLRQLGVTVHDDPDAILPQGYAHKLAIGIGKAARVETIAGVSVDPIFGPMLMFGLGGVATELAVVDLKMPGKGGLELVKALLEIDPQTKIVVLTGYGTL